MEGNSWSEHQSHEILLLSPRISASETARRGALDGGWSSSHSAVSLPSCRVVIQSSPKIVGIILSQMGYWLLFYPQIPTLTLLGGLMTTRAMKQLICQIWFFVVFMARTCSKLDCLRPVQVSWNHHNPCESHRLQHVLSHMCTSGSPRASKI